MTSRKFLLVFAAILFLPVAVLAQTAPSVYFKTNEASYAPGSEFAAKVFISSPDLVNGINLVIDYSDNLKFTGANNAHSVVDVWQKNPKEISPREIVLTGGLTQPFSGTDGEVIELNFKVLNEGTASLTVKSADFYIANGLGTDVKPESLALNLPIEKGAPQVALENQKNTPPPTVQVIVTLNPVDKSQLLIVQTKDSNVGVKDTLMRDKAWFAWSDWQSISGPIKVPDDAWLIQVKAVNNNNQESLASVYIWGQFIKRIVMIFSIPILIFILFLLYNKKIFRKNKSKPKDL